MSEKPRITLDTGQREAVHAPANAPTHVIAGAGTGKTRVLVERYVRLIDEGMPIERLLALTFTLKAAGEMRERVRRAIADRHPHLSRQLSNAWIMNFHQFGYRFIKENAPALGIDPGVDVVSIAEFERIQRVLRARFENGRVPGVPSDFGGSPPPPTKLGSLFDTLLNVVHQCRSIMLDPQTLRTLVREDDHPAYIARVDTVVALAREYEAELQRRGLLDFSDMITIPARALTENATLTNAYRNAFDHILVDEFQDTSAAQNELLRALSGGDFSRVTVVGDKKQSIYRWRDARVENVDEFPAVQSPQLATNYRSRQAILDLAHALISNEPELEDAAVPLTADRKEGPTSVILFHPEDGKDRHEDEAEALGAWVDHMLNRKPAPPDWQTTTTPTEEPGLEPHDIAVLMRSFKSSKLMPEIERVFQRRGIPFAIVGGANRVEARALETWHAWASLLLPGDRDVDLVAVLESPPYEVSEASLAELFRKAGQHPDPQEPQSSEEPVPQDAAEPVPQPAHRAVLLERLDDSQIAKVTDERDATAMRDLRESINRAQHVWMNQGFREFLVWSIETSPLRTRLLRDGARLEAVDELMRELLDLADGLARRGEVNLATFLDHLRASLEERKFREDGEAVLPRNRVGIMTVHQAKGLEWPAVAVVGVVEGSSRSESFLVSRESGLYFGEKTGKPWKREKNRADNYAKEKRMEDIEERCILYVALTRARDHLWVSAPSVEGKKLLSKEARPWLFTELVDASRNLNLAKETRTVEGVQSSASTPSSPREPQPHAMHEADDTEQVLREWVDLRARNTIVSDPFPKDHIVTVTWSDLMSYARCPYQFKLNKERGQELEQLEVPDEVHTGDHRDSAVPLGVDPQTFGRFVHEILQRTTGTPLDEAIEASLPRYDLGKKKHTATQTARQLVEHAINAGLAGPKEGAQAEVPFMVRLNHILLRGTIDRVDTTPNGTIITDYKVGARSDDHTRQAQAYAWAAQRAGIVSPVTARVAYLRGTGADSVSVSMDHQIEHISTDLDAAVASRTFPANPGTPCARCAHRGVCEFGMRIAG
ncbi:MAG TPA: ATP-dependent DNA helicase [Candidatus Krumholzibacteria bacterium]|nr:ATP-dependent DNA helicase [Candidatus Krumholzibacteria bacterium]